MWVISGFLDQKFKSWVKVEMNCKNPTQYTRIFFQKLSVLSLYKPWTRGWRRGTGSRLLARPGTQTFLPSQRHLQIWPDFRLYMNVPSILHHHSISTLCKLRSNLIQWICFKTVGKVRMRIWHHLLGKNEDEYKKKWLSHWFKYDEKCRKSKKKYLLQLCDNRN